MQSENRVCQNCKIQFVVESEDLAFYDNIKVPPPTFCPQCRHVRRLAWCHSMRLYRRTCDVPGHSEDIISKYPSISNVTVYDASYWWSDAWDPINFGAAYDFNQPFFEQLDSLYSRVPLPSTDVKNSVNCDYSITAQNSKNCYLISGGFRSEDCLYSDTPAFCKSVVDSYACLSSDTLYECIYCDGSFNLKYSAFCESCMDSAFLYDCKGCSDCFGCVNLRNKKYCIFNVQYSKSEYREKIKDFDISSREKVREFRKKHMELQVRYPNRYANIVRSINCTGDVISEGKNCKNCFEIRQGAENCKYVFLAGVGTKDSYDVFGGGATSALLYESKSVTGSERVFFSNKITGSTNIYYSLSCDGSSDLFGCVGLRHKQYCVFNRQYSEKEYKDLVAKIIAHMNDMPYVDNRGITYRFGEFPPASFSPIPYNESFAQVLYPLDSVRAAAQGYHWQVPEQRNFRATIDAKDIPSSINEVTDGIASEILKCIDEEGGCDHGCLKVFKIIPQELDFYRKTKAPLPDLCPTCRYGRRLDRIRFRITNIHQFRRKCQCAGGVSDGGNYKNLSSHFHADRSCTNPFLTSYGPDRPEIIYCEQCYQAEL